MKSMLVCGCSSGIGEHLFNYYVNGDEYCVSGISRTHGVDATDPDQVFRVIKEIKPDILINCIGQAAMNHTILTSINTYDQIMDANMKSTFALCREAARYMVKYKYGRIINFGSCAVSMGIEGESIYAASKSAVLTFSRILAKELAPHVTVNCISLGPCDTRLIRNVPKEKIRKIIDQQIIKRMTTVEEVRHVVDFLLDSPMITGQNIYINGAG